MHLCVIDHNGYTNWLEMRRGQLFSDGDIRGGKKEVEGRSWYPHGARLAAHRTHSMLGGADHVNIMAGNPRHRKQEKVRLETRPKDQSRVGLPSRCK